MRLSGTQEETTAGRQRLPLAPGAEDTVWNSSSTKLEGLGDCLRFASDAPERPHLMIKAQAKGHTLTRKAKQNNPTLAEPETKPLQDQGDPPAIYLPARTELSVLFRKINPDSL